MVQHLIIKAGAGTGKTFCVTEGVHRQLHNKRDTVGSPEQQAVWEAMLVDKYPGRIHLTSFTVDAADQLESKCPTDIYGKSAVGSSSTYGMGISFAKAAGQAGTVDRYGTKYKGLVSDFMGATKYESDQRQPGVWGAIHEIQAKARLELVRTASEDQVIKIADYFGIELERRHVEQVTDGVNQVLKAGIIKNHIYDFTDMVYIPVITSLVRKRYDTLIVDEFQDMGRAQQELCINVSNRRILIGDEHQAIYGFAGADQSAFERLEKYLGQTAAGVKIMPLNESRRCAKSIVERANKLVPELRAMPNAPDGKVIDVDSREQFYLDHLPKIKKIYGTAGNIDSDMMIICPTNAPLIALMFKFQKAGIKSFVHGKDITETMQSFVNRFEGGIAELRLEIDRKLAGLWGRKASKSTDLQIDIYSALKDLANECSTPGDVTNSISNIFSDTPRPGWLKMSSIHRSKGLEADTVVIWEVNNCKSRYSTLPWQHLQDKNLQYVGETRAKRTLIEVRGGLR